MFFLLFLIIDFLIVVGTGQIFNLIAELVMAIGILTKELKAEMEIHPVTIDDKIKNC